MTLLKNFLVGAVALGVMTGAGVARDRIQAATWAPPAHQASVYFHTFFAEAANKRAAGILDVEAEVGSSMLTPRGAMAELADGIVDLSTHMGQYTPTELAVSNSLEELAMLYSDPRVIIAATTEFGLTDPDMLAEWKKNRVVFGGGFVTGQYRLICNKKIATLDDLKGAKLRLPGRAPAAWANGEGAVTVALSLPEQYGALDKGALNCTTTTLSDTFSNKVYEVAPHVTDLPITLFWSGFGWAYNPQSWAELSPEQRRVLFDAKADAIAAYIVRGLIVAEDEAREKLVEAGVEFHQPEADLVDSIVAYREKQSEVAETIAAETFGLNSPADVLRRFKSTIEKWEARLADVPADDEATYAEMLRTEIFDKVDVETYPAQ
ncbi:C4-dicarboxylate TRAP transporter substrate-binding protein [Litoreibacter albidus]|uniref:TRAP-type C4-dicarboxylate transport system, substrate-binding protein n=1 Tax=Litoreibacter albidus TaxID=670155 RepID=A0A1H3CKK5_9RHOB|nr:C4-dicarboxylate TRAP transporter substrate-binding protein [Litoreibacter albidus]SDX54550.1 TRAP-type C4-dicarboxylate transport system, substrate-binding protein [Litoreibacter albidus]